MVIVTDEQLYRPHFYQTRSAWSVDQGSTRKCFAVHNFAPTVTKFCVMWEGLSLPHDTKFGNCRDEIVDRRVIFIWPSIHGSAWSGLIKAEPGRYLGYGYHGYAGNRSAGATHSCTQLVEPGGLRHFPWLWNRLALNEGTSRDATKSPLRQLSWVEFHPASDMAAGSERGIYSCR